MGQFSLDALERIPTDPGVYLMKDAAGKVVYVGKAKSLRTRVRQYFRPGGDSRLFVAAGILGKVLADIETVVVTNEKEALLLENHLIKKHQPRFNVNLRDDKQYLVLRVLPPVVDPAAAKAARYPRVEVVRNIRDDGARYFGPYHSATSARETLRLLNRHFQLRTCTDHVVDTRGRPCLQYQIKRCPGPCAFAMDDKVYADQVEDAMLFLGGKDKELVVRLRERMAARAGAEDFEVAAAIRDSISAVEKVLARQHVVQDDFVDQDVFGLWRQGDVAELVVLFIRAGKLVGRRAFQQRDMELPDAEVISQLVQQYYATGTLVPDEIIVGVELDDVDVLADWLSAAAGKRVKVMRPQRGTKVRLVELADKNAEASAAARKGRDADAVAGLEKLQARLGLRNLPRRIECFDIAHIQGTETVASMVTFIDGVAARAMYRKFKIKTSGNDDFASMYEVLTRRFRKSQRSPGTSRREGPHAAEGGGPPGRGAEIDAAWAAPDLLVIDGGKGQLGMAVAALGDLGIRLEGDGAIDVIGLAKERELEAGEAPDRVYLRNIKEPVQLRPNSAELFVLARIRDEAHRFANTFHQQRRSKAMLRSTLDEIPGIGATRRKALLRHFGSVKAIREASLEALAVAPGMNKPSADAVHRFFAEAPPDELVDPSPDAGDDQPLLE